MPAKGDIDFGGLIDRIGKMTADAVDAALNNTEGRNVVVNVSSGPVNVNSTWPGAVEASNATDTSTLSDAAIALRELVSIIGQLSGVLEAHGRTVADLNANLLLERKFDEESDDVGVLKGQAERYLDIARDPIKKLDEIMSEAGSIFKRFTDVGGMKYSNEPFGKNVIKAYGRLGEGANAIREAFHSGDIVKAITGVKDLSTGWLHQKVREAEPLIQRHEADERADAMRKEAEQARKEADEAQKRAAEIQRKAEEERQAFQKQIADLEKSTAEAQKRFAETSGAGAGGGSVPPASVGGGGGSENGIRYFQSLKELTDYLDGLSMGELRGVSSEIQKIFESLNGLDPEAKNISALFDNDNTLRALALSAVSKKFGSAEIASMQYAFGMKPVNPEDEDSPLMYTINRAQTRTTTHTDKIAKYQADLEAREQALITKLTAMRNLPIMQGDASTNGLVKQWEEIARFSADGGIELINKGNLSDIEEAEVRFKSLQGSIKAINDLITKKWANNSIEKMTENAEEMESMRKTLPDAFSKIGISSADLFKDFDAAAAKFHAAVDPKEQALAYNEMAKAIRNVKKTLTEENSAYNENIRLAKQQQKIDRSSKVMLSRYKEKYDQMGNGRPDQYKKARDAVKRYNNARDAADREAAYKDYEENMAWMRDDLDVRYPKYQKREKQNDTLAKQNRRVYRNVTAQKKQMDKTLGQLADLATPYGGLESQTLPDYIQNALKKLDSIRSEGNIETRISGMKELSRLVEIAKNRSKQDKSLADANELLSKMSTESPMTSQQAAQLQTAVDRVNGLTDSSSAKEIADAYADLAAKIREAAEAQSAFEKAEQAADKRGMSEDALISGRTSAYEGFLKQLQSIQKSFADMGQIVDTSNLETLIDAFNYTDVFDSKAMSEARNNVNAEMKRLRQQLDTEKSIFAADNKRTSKVNTLNEWIDGLSIDDQQIQKIQELRTALEQLNAIDLRAPDQLAVFNAQLANVDELEEAAKKQIDILKRYRDATSDKNFGLMGGEHGVGDTERNLSQALKKNVQEAYAAWQANPDDVALYDALNDALKQVEDRLKSISTIDAFGKLEEQAVGFRGQIDLLKNKIDQSKWSDAQRKAETLFGETYDKYQDQVKAGNLQGATESVTMLKNQVTALNQSFEKGGGLVGVFDGKMSKLAGRLLGVGSGFMAINKVISTYKRMVGYVTQIDTAMTELKKVTDESAAAYARFQKESGKTAIAIGSSVTDLINTSVEYGRMGYSLAESQQLGVVTTKFANTGNFNGVTEASDALISIIRGFDELDTSDAEAVSDKLTAVANAYAVTASDIAAGLQRSASALNLAGTDVDQATAMITAIAEVTRDAQAAGNAVKVMSMRIRGAKTE